MVGGWTRRRKSRCFPFPATAWMGRQPSAASFSFQHSRLQSEVQRGTPMLKSRHFVFHGHWKPPLPLGGWADGPLALADDRPLAAPLWFLSLLWPAFENVWSVYGGGEGGGFGRRLWPFVSQPLVFMCLDGRTIWSTKAKEGAGSIKTGHWSKSWSWLVPLRSPLFLKDFAS